MNAIKNITFILSAFVILQGCKRDDLQNPDTNSSLLEKTASSGSGNVLGSPGTIYFSQNFNSSTDYTKYEGKNLANNTSLFDAVDVTGNKASLNTLNNKLQIVKSGGPGINRASATRKTTLASGPAKFLKYSMEITVSNNTEDVDNGFQFTVGKISSTAPAAPPRGEIHSLLRINPTKNLGEFILQTGLDGAADMQSSIAYTGTYTIVWYINNSGAPVGYTAPDGEAASVQDDASDVWVVNGTSELLAIDEAPAITSANPLNNFKIANNPNFNATLDIDDMVLSEEPSIPVPVIVSVATPPAVNVPQKTEFSLLPLAKELEVTYDDGNKQMVKIEWIPGTTGYNQYMLGEYTALGTIIPKRGTINPNNISVSTSVSIRNDIKIVNAFSPNNDGKNDVWINPELKYYRNSSVEVFDRSGVRLFYSTNPEEGWDGKNQHGQIIAGPYSYIIKVPNLSLVKKGVVTIIK